MATPSKLGKVILRISIAADAVPEPGEFTYEDKNFPGRAGWKEIVIDHDPAIAIQDSSQGSQDLSKGLTYYPTDPSITPPQDLAAHVEWSRSTSGVLPRPIIKLSATRPLMVAA